MSTKGKGEQKGVQRPNMATNQNNGTFSYEVSMGKEFSGGTPKVRRSPTNISSAL